MKRVIIILALVAGLIISCQKEDFTHSGMADDHFFLQNGGQNMPVFVAGNLDSKKMILILHGGPGATSLLYREKYVIDNVESKFSIIYWDQRFAGMTQGNGGSTDVDVFRDDVKKLIYLLKAKYGSDQKIYLFAHSWGGFLAPYFLLNESNEQMVEGWIQIGGAHNYSLNDSLTKEMLMFYGNKELNADRNVSFWEDVVEWCKTHDYHGEKSAMKLNKFANIAERMIDEISESGSSDKSIFSEDVSIWSNMANTYSSGLHKIHLKPYDYPNSDNLHILTLPVLLLWGKYDFVCPSGLADDIEENIGSTDVKKVIFEHSGHGAMFTERELFWSKIIDWIEIH